MIVLARELLGALKAARLFASEDETRPHINCVHVEAVGGALRLVATDGHTLWCSDIPATDSAADPAPAHQTPWNIALDDVEGIVRHLKDVPAEVEVLLAKRVVGGLSYAGREVEHFAPYHAVVSCPFAGKAAMPPELDPTYFARVSEAFAAYGKGFAPEIPKVGKKDEKQAARTAREGFLSPPLTWRTGGELDPVFFFFSPKFPAAFAIVMPRRGGNSGADQIKAYLDRVRQRPSDALRAVADAQSEATP